MRIESCEFPDDLLYDEEGLVWARLEDNGELTLGATTIYTALTGRLAKVVPKAVGSTYDRGQAVALLESPRYFGPVRSPVAGVLVGVNEAAIADPKRITDAPYAEGWLTRLRPSQPDAVREALKPLAEAKEALAKQISTLRVHCYVAFPDYEMFEIGTECAAVLTKLDELAGRMKSGEVVHVVSDDWTAPTEMENWSARTGQPVIDQRTEGKLYHFLVRKTR